MRLIKLKPINNSTRHQLNIKKNLLSKYNNLVKNLNLGLKKNSGRSNSNGRITVRHQGGGCKKLYRVINFFNQNFCSIIISTSYDPNRSAFISLNYNLQTKLFFNTLATEGVFPGSIISCDNSSTHLKLGCRLLLINIPTGSLIHTVSANKYSKGCFIRAAGTFGQLIQKDFNFCKLKMPSGQILKLPSTAYATIGVLTNNLHNSVVLGKAGRNRHKGVRPSVRGIAMNPVDHPHGGRSNGGKPSVTPWGIPTKGKPTVKKKL